MYAEDEDGGSSGGEGQNLGGRKRARGGTGAFKNTSQDDYAVRHKAAEARRRARVNERIEALRKLVPHDPKANTATFLEEVIKYILTLKDSNERLEAAMLGNTGVDGPPKPSSTQPPRHQGGPQGMHSQPSPADVASNLHAVLQQVELQQAAQLLSALPLPTGDTSGLLGHSDQVGMRPNPTVSALMLRGLSPQPGLALEAHGDSASSRAPTLMRLGGLEGLTLGHQQRAQEQLGQPALRQPDQAPEAAGAESLQQPNGATIPQQQAQNLPGIQPGGGLMNGKSQEGAGVGSSNNTGAQPQGGMAGSSQAPVHMHPLLAQLQLGPSGGDSMQGLAGLLGSAGAQAQPSAAGGPMGAGTSDWQQLMRLQQQRPNAGGGDMSGLQQANGAPPMHSLLANLQPSVLQSLQQQLMQPPAAVTSLPPTAALHPLLAGQHPNMPQSTAGLMQALTTPMAQMLQQQQQQQQRQLHQLLQSAMAHAQHTALNGG